MRVLHIISILLLSYFLSAEPLTESKKLSVFFNDEWEYTLKEFPLTATFVGDSRYNDQIGDFSYRAILRRQQHDLDARNRLKVIKRADLSDNEKLNYDLFLDNLDRSIQGHPFPDYLMPITQLGGIHIDAPSLGENLPLQKTKDYQDFISRMKKLPQTLDQTIELMQIGLEHKITPPKITLTDVAEQINAQIIKDPEQSPFFKPFQQFPASISIEEQKNLQTQAKQVIETLIVPAYKKLYEFWTQKYYPSTRNTTALSSLPNGQAWYTYLAKTHTTTELTPKEIHDIGLSEVKRIQAEMDGVMRQSGFQGSFQEFIQFLRHDPQFFYTKPEDLLTGYRDICKRIDAQLPKFFGKLPRTPYGVKEIPSYAAQSSTTAYYVPGSMEAGTPGWFYANTYRLDARPKWEMEALTIHEAVPGHHLQLSIAMELENVPRFRNFLFFTAFVEGWGLYSESLGVEMGFYKDVYSKFGQLDYEMWRACRLVVDTGLHVFGWDRQKAIDYFKANSSDPEPDIIVEVDRYITNPGQALAYKIGELKIKELRKYSSDQLGEKFDIREFHDRVLEQGAVPLSLLEKHIKEYVAKKRI